MGKDMKPQPLQQAAYYILCMVHGWRNTYIYIYTLYSILCPDHTNTRHVYMKYVHTASNNIAVPSYEQKPTHMGPSATKMEEFPGGMG